MRPSGIYIISYAASRQKKKLNYMTTKMAETPSASPSASLTMFLLTVCATVCATTTTTTVCATTLHSDVVLTQGTTASLLFHFSWPPQSDVALLPYFTIKFESRPRPFFQNNNPPFDINGLKSQDQMDRFTVTFESTNGTLVVNLTITDVQPIDEDVYHATLLLFMYHGDSTFQQVSQKTVSVYRPPGKAKCFVTPSSDTIHLLETHCFASAGNRDATLSCYQNGYKIPYIRHIRSDKKEIRGVFWTVHDRPLSCCSHRSDVTITHDTCVDFTWPPMLPTAPLPDMPDVISTKPIEIFDVTMQDSRSGSDTSLFFPQALILISVIVQLSYHLNITF